MKRILLSAGLLFLTANIPADRISPDSARAALLEADIQFCQATQDKGLEGFASFLADQVTTIRPNSPIMTSKDEMRTQWAMLLKDSSLRINWRPSLANASTSGDLGYTVGSYEITRTDEQGKRVVGSGKYVTIWKKQADGSWKVVFDSGVQDDPPQAPSP